MGSIPIDHPIGGQLRKVKVYIDLDGVLADFDTHLAHIAGTTPEVLLSQRQQSKEYDDYVWEVARNDADFYINLPLMNHNLWEAVKPYNPTVLTAVPKAKRNMPKAGPDKVAWVHKNLGNEVPVIICQRAEVKILSKRIHPY